MSKTENGRRGSTPDARDARPSHSLPRGFTLPELLVVITIIAILLGLLFSAIKTVARYSRETITRSELVTIEAAWKQYFAYYHCWPTNDVEAAGTTTSMWPYDHPADGDIRYEIGPRLARMLEGAAITNSQNTVLNPDGVVFLELTRFDGAGAPINAWGASRGQRYWVKLDANGDNTVEVPTNLTTSGFTTNVVRSVGVWTINPDKNSILGSWQQ